MEINTVTLSLDRYDELAKLENMVNQNKVLEIRYSSFNGIRTRHLCDRGTIDKEIVSINENLAEQLKKQDLELYQLKIDMRAISIWSLIKLKIGL
jgi:hypothetical protein